MNHNSIGLFDSGIGGLTVLDNLRKKLPNEHYVYIGDNLHCPYGDKTKEQLFQYACLITDYFISRNIQLIVLACNTVSANVLGMLQQQYPDITFIGVIDATVSLVSQSEFNSCLVIATNATIQSHQYQAKLQEYFKDVYAVATPDLVGFVENRSEDSVIIDYLEKSLKDFYDIPVIVLGCTHYPILSNHIQTVLKRSILISSSEAIVGVVESYLKKHSLISSTKGAIEIYTTGDVESFVCSSKSFFDYQDDEVIFIKLDD